MQVLVRELDFAELEDAIDHWLHAAFLVQGKQRLKEGGRALTVGVGKGGAGHRLDSQMVKVLHPGFQAGDAIPQTGSSRKLHGESGPSGRCRARSPTWQNDVSE